MEKLTEENFRMYAMRVYDNPHCILSEKAFDDDLKRIKYVKRLFNRYSSTGILMERLILNHLIIFYNMFGGEHGTRILFYKIDKQFYPILKTFLVYLNYMPDQIEGVMDKLLISSDIPLDMKIVDKLRKI